MAKQPMKADVWRSELDLVLSAIRADREAELVGYGIRRLDAENQAIALVVETNKLLDYVLNARSFDPKPSSCDDRSMLLHQTKRVASKAAFLMQLIKNGEA